MNTKANYAIVGAFVIIFLIGIIFSIIWLSSGLSIKPTKYYLVYSQESVSGLTTDAPVEYNGVNVGSVKDISLDAANPNLVRLLLKVYANTPVTRGTVAVLTSRGITGVAFIVLKDNGQDLGPPRIIPNQPYPVIPSSPSIFMRLDIALTKLSKNMEEVANSLNNLLSEANLKSLEGILHNFDKVAESMAHNTVNLDIIMRNFAKTTVSLTPLIQNTNTGVRAINQQIIPLATKTFNRLDDTTNMLHELLRKLHQNPAMLIRGTAEPQRGPGE